MLLPRNIHTNKLVASTVRFMNHKRSNFVSKGTQREPFATENSHRKRVSRRILQQLFRSLSEIEVYESDSMFTTSKADREAIATVKTIDRGEREARKDDPRGRVCLVCQFVSVCQSVT